MAVPDEIANNSLVVSAKIRAWTDWFKAGKGIKSDTYANLKALAIAAPTEAFICIATDVGGKSLMVYMADTNIGDEGFLLLGGGGGGGSW